MCMYVGARERGTTPISVQDTQSRPIAHGGATKHDCGTICMRREHAEIGERRKQEREGNTDERTTALQCKQSKQAKEHALRVQLLHCVIPTYAHDAQHDCARAIICGPCSQAALSPQPMQVCRLWGPTQRVVVAPRTIDIRLRVRDCKTLNGGQSVPTRSACVQQRQKLKRWGAPPPHHHHTQTQTLH